MEWVARFLLWLAGLIRAVAYAAGRDDANRTANAEEEARIRIADAARLDAERAADPDGVREDDGHRRDD